MESATVTQLPAPAQDQQLVQQVQGHLTSLNRIDAGLGELKKRFGGLVFKCDTKEGMKDAKDARQSVRQVRFDVERIRKEAKAPINALAKLIDGTARRLTDAVLEVEAPIDDQIKAQEAIAERARQEAIQREQERVTAIRNRIEAIRSLPLRAVGKASGDFKALNDELAALKEFDFAEFAPQALAEAIAVGSTLATMFKDRLRFEDDQKALAKQREDLERQQADLRQQQAALREQEAAKPALPLYGAPDEEAAPIPLPAGPPVRSVSLRPTEEEIIGAVALHFHIDRATALAWLRDCQFTEVV